MLSINRSVLGGSVMGLVGGVRGGCFALVACAGLAVAPGAFGQVADDAADTLRPAANGPKRAESTFFALVNCTLHVSPKETIEHATVVCRDGKIVAILKPTEEEGKTVPARLPLGPRTVDATGMHVYPGFVEPMLEVAAPTPVAEGSTQVMDLNHYNAEVTPGRSALAGIGTGENGFTDDVAAGLRKMGFAAAAIAPKGGVFRGRMAVVSLAKPGADASTARASVYREDVGQYVAFETARRGYPDSEMGAIALVRQVLGDAAFAAKFEKKAGAPMSALDWLHPERRVPIWFDAGDELQELRALKVAAEFDRPIVIVGTGTEYARLGALAARKPLVVLPLSFGKAPDVSSVAKQEGTDLREMMAWEQGPTNPRRVVAAGMKVALTSAKMRKGESFLGNLRSAVKHGLSESDALAGLTTRPAELLGLSDELGTIEVGKRASMVVTDKPIFDDECKVRVVYVDGVMHEISKPDLKLEGRWAVRVDGKASGYALEVDDGNGVTVRLTGADGKIRKTKAKKSQVVDEAVSFVFEHEELNAKPKGDVKPVEGVVPVGPVGAVTVSGVVIRDRGGKPERIVGEGVGDHGERFVFEAVVAPSLEGRWAMNFAADPASSKVLLTNVTATVVDQDGAVKAVVEGEEKPIEATEVLWDGSALEYTLKVGDGAPMRVVASVDLDASPDVMRGALSNGAGKYKFDAERTSVVGTYLVTELDGKPAPADEKWYLRVGRKDLSILVVREDGTFATTDGADVKIDGTKVTFTHKLKPLLKDEVPADLKSSDEATISGNTLRGKGTLSSGGEHAYVAVRVEGDDLPLSEKVLEKRLLTKMAIAEVPEKLPVPFSAWGRFESAAQGTVFITGATVWTQTDLKGAGGVMPGASVLVKDGKIAAVISAGGAVPELPADAVRVDAKGMHLTPGIVDCHSHTGISRGVNEGGQAVTSEVRVADVTNPDSISWYRQLAGGVTSVNNLHGSANAIGGQSQTNKIRWGVEEPSDMHFEGAMPGIKFALGENPSQVNGSGRARDRYPNSRMGVENLIRDRFVAAQEYRAARVAAEKSGKPFRADLELDALVEILEGKRLIHCHSYRQDEIVMLSQIAKEFGFKIGTYQHILEGYKVADAIRESVVPGGGASAFSDWWAYKVEVQDAIPYGGAIMQRQGVNVSFNSDSDEMARRLNQEAGKAQRYDPGRGKADAMTHAQALAMVTTNPARQLQIDSRVGTIEVGKDADLALWNGDPLSVYSSVEMTMVDGRVLFSKADDAARRDWIAKERTRLIQKILVERKLKKAADEEEKDDKKDDTKQGEKNAKDGEKSPGGDKPEGPIEHLSESEMLAVRMRYLEMLRSGRDPASMPGVCGCGSHW